MSYPINPTNGQIYKDYQFNSSLNLWRKTVISAKTIRSTQSPSYAGRRLAAQTSYSNTNFIPIDTGHNIGDCFNTSTGEFTCTITGKYLVMWQGLVYSVGNSLGHAYVSFYVGAVEKTSKSHTMYNIVRKYEPLAITSIVDAVAGDKITCRITTNYCTIWGGAGTPHCNMAICFVN